MITAESFSEAIISGANNIFKNRVHINELNIFPVPDGDTGTNMSMTIQGAVDKIKSEHKKISEIYKVADMLASASLRSSRGNSGVILSLIFKGFAQAFANLEAARQCDIIKAFELATKNAYDAVSKPTEGTMLSVIRVAYEDAREAFNSGMDSVFIWEQACLGARKALASTPELLPVLQKAGVVDAGGKGLCLILEGMLSVFKNNIIIDKNVEDSVTFDDDFKDAVSKFDDDTNHIYCTEFIIGKAVNSGINENICAKFKESLEIIGDCVIISEDNDIIKTHVHTDFPQKVLDLALKIGVLLTVKIENMIEQHKRMLEASSVRSTEEVIEGAINCEIDPNEKMGIVSVACGEGLINAFVDLGVNKIIVGGQTMNPSAGEIADAALSVPAKVVFLLPNNKNILLAAEQATELVKDRELIVIPSKTIPQGLSALMVYDPELEVHENIHAMNQAMELVKTGLISYAERDAEFNGIKIKKSDILALNCGKLAFKSKSPIDAAFKLVRIMANKKTMFVNLIYGRNVLEDDVVNLKEKLKKKFPNMEIQTLNGGNEIYYFIISVE